MAKLTDKFKNAWNQFRHRKGTYDNILDGNDSYYFRDPLEMNHGEESYSRPDRFVISLGGEKSIISSIINRIGIDVAAISFRHVRLNENGGFSKIIDSELNNCLETSANIDQSGRAFIQDIAMSMCDEGAVAVVPTFTSENVDETDCYKIYSMRVAQIVGWFPHHIRVSLYNEDNGKREEIILNKSDVAIIENPLYTVMNEPNSTMARLKHKLMLLDKVDEQASSNKLDLIIQFPFTIRSKFKREEAERRRRELEDQLANSRYGVGYIDAAEKVVQLNRSLENNLLDQINGLISMVYAQLGLTENVFNGTAEQEELMNYYNRTIEPICAAIAGEFRRKFLTDTARTQGQDIRYFNDPFKLTKVSEIAEMVDKFTRNEIMSPNEMRSVIGLKQINDERSDELRNRNLNQEAGADKSPTTGDTLENNSEDEKKDNNLLEKRVSNLI